MTKLAAAQAEILELRVRLAAREEALRAHEDELVQLRAQIAWLKKQLFGSKSERLDRRQLELMLEGLEERAARLEAAAPAVGPARAAPQPRLPREERYGHLPVLEEVVHEPAEVLAEPEAYERIGEERTFEVVYEPGRFYRRAIIRPKYRRKADRQVAPLVVPAPARVVEGIASIELLVQLVLSKYLDHQPLYRQCRIYQREGVSFARPSLVRWVETVADWLKPIYHYMGKELKAGGYIQADETPIHYLDADVQKGKARQGYLVPFSRPGGDVVFTWALSRSEKAITPFLTGFKGLLQTDAYVVWHKYAARHEDIIPLACWAHARRKFHQAMEEAPIASAILADIGHLYALEAQYREGGLDAPHRRARRQIEALPLLNKLKEQIAAARAQTLPKTALGKACDYALGNWPALLRYCEHGQAEIDNNLVENAIRPSAIGRKNWLFIGHPDAGDRPAILYSLLISCQRHGHDPRAYLIDVLRRLVAQPNRHNPSNLNALTPAHWKAKS